MLGAALAPVWRLLSRIGLAGWLAIGAAVLVLWMWAGWSRAADARDDFAAQLARAQAQIALLNTDLALKEAAASERQADSAATRAAEQELIDAISRTPDEQPDAVRVRLGCERLRRAGTPAADLPAVC